jgi:hypothetical protein
MNKAADWLAVLAILHMTFYAITGVSLVSPLQQGDGLRAMLLFFMHFVPVFYAGVRRLPC